MKQIILLSIFICVYLHNAAQNVGIGTNTPNSSAQLDVSSSTKGFLMPRMTTAQRNAIVSPVKGLQVFNLDDLCTDIFDGINWIKNCGFKQQTDSTTLPGDFWVRKANFGGETRYGSVGFSIGNKGYVGTGQGGISDYLKDFWEYDPLLNIWTQKADFGGTARSFAVGLSIGTTGYIGTGFNNGNRYNDFWAYNPSLNSWVQKADFVGGIRTYALCFAVGNRGYIGLGYDLNTPKNDLWEYNPATNSWVQKASFPGVARINHVSFSIGTKGYLGTGVVPGVGLLKDFWEFNPGIDGALGIWTQKADFGGTERTAAVGFSIGGKGYIGTGKNGGGVLKDFWEYDPSLNTWIKRADYGGSGTAGGVGFSIGSKGYIGIGDQFSYGGFNGTDLWEYTSQPSKVLVYSSNTLPVEASVTDGIWTRLGNTVYSVTEVGNVGIGTSTPSNKLSVTGNADFSGNVGIGNSSPPNKLSVTGNADFSGNVGIGNSSPPNKLSVTGNADFSGNVGIGTTTPTSAKLVISGTASQEGLDLSSTDQYANMRVLRNSLFGTDKDMFIGYQSGGTSSLHLYSNNNETVTIKGNNAGIGNTNPVAKLHITGDEYLDGSLRIRNNATTNNYGKIEHSGAGGNFHLDTYGTGAMYLNYFSGNGVLIGNGASAITATFSTNGNLTIAGTLTQSSDSRLKKNIEPLTNSLRNLLQLNGYTYNWQDAGKDSLQQIGILAQEVEKIFPALVTTNVDGYKSVNYIGLIPVMIESIKEQQQQIEKQNQQIDTLNKLVQKLLK